jgi:excisionase family DNA binding protein
MEEVEQAASFAIAEAKSRGLAEVGADELLLGCLQAVGRFGVVALGAVVLDLEELGVAWLQSREKGAGKVGYSVAVVGLFDLAARIAKADGAGAVRIEHLLVAFAGMETGLMGEMKRRYGLSSATWRAAMGQFAAAAGQTPEVMGGIGSAGVARDFLTPEEAAEALGIHVQTLRGYVRSGKLPAMRLAGERAIRIRRSDLETVLEPLVTQGMQGLT